MRGIGDCLVQLGGLIRVCQVTGVDFTELKRIDDERAVFGGVNGGSTQRLITGQFGHQFGQNAGIVGRPHAGPLASVFASQCQFHRSAARLRRDDGPQVYQTRFLVGVLKVDLWHLLKEPRDHLLGCRAERIHNQINDVDRVVWCGGCR